MRNGNNFNNPAQKVKILVAPLDWGLGHATRCIPIIKQLIFQGCEVYIAASGGGFFLLKKEFPNTVILRLKSYKIRYSINKKWLPILMSLQFPAILFSVMRERVWLRHTIDKYHITAVISDNRFGMYSKKAQGVYITHQISIKTGNHFSEYIAKKIHWHFIKKYNYCWIPDYYKNGLAGELSHLKKISPNISYIGPLSRFELLKDVAKKYDILVALSGPEPQRTILENLLLSQIKGNPAKILFVRGLPGQNKIQINDTGNLKIIDHLSGEELNEAFQQSELIISRSGYTTIMDLIKLRKKAILVPTPGQTEQEYLAHHLMKNNIFYCIDQDTFSLDSALSGAAAFKFNHPSYAMDDYKKVVNEFVQSLKSGNFAAQ